MTTRMEWWQTRAFHVAALLLVAMPLLWPTIPPLTDLPGHMARWRVMLGDDADVLSRWYRFDWRLAGNLGVDLIVRALAPLIGLEPAVKLTIIAIPVATAAAILWLSREIHGRVQPWAIAALPLSYNYAFDYGFVNFALSMALAVAAFALWLRLTRLGRLRLRGVLFAGLALVVWTAHLVGWGVLGLTVWGSEVARARADGCDWGRALYRASLAVLPVALPILPMLAWRSGDGAGVTIGWLRWDLKVAWIVMILRDRWAAIDIAGVMLLAGLLYHGWRSRDVRRSRISGLPLLLLIAAFVVLPFRILDSAYADMRLAPWLAVFALLALGTRDTMPRRRVHRVVAVALLFLVVRLAATTASYALYDRDWRAHLAALDHLPRGSRVMAMVGVACEQDWATPRTEHLPGMAVVRRAAFANDQWRLGAGSPLTILRDGIYDADPSQMVVGAPCPRAPELRGVADAMRAFPRADYDYLWLIAPPPFDPHLLRGLHPVWRGRGGDGLYRIARPLHDTRLRLYRLAS